MANDKSRWRTVHLVSDGTPFETKFTDEEGKEILGVVSFDIRMDVDSEIASMILELRPALVDIDTTVSQVRFNCPLCGNSATHDCKTGITKND
jgi:transcription initiation factor IIE alpha subunit